MRAILFSLCICMLGTAGAQANDTAAELAIGGLTLTQSDSIRMDSEDLYISRDAIRVSYSFTNTSDQDIETLVAFPLPDIASTAENSDGGFPDYKEALKFRTTLDGKPLRLDFVETAMFNGEDVSGRVKALGLPLMAETADFVPAIEALSAQDREALVADGLIADIEPSTDYTVWAPQWVLKTSVTRKQVFPAGKTIKVEHSYVPIAGGSVAGGFSKEYRNSENGKSWLQTQRRKYCIEDSWLNSLDRRMAKSEKAKETYSEVWLGYVLSTGANWKGPIGDFRLVVDKGKPDSLVSFCAEGVKKISPTQFEVRKTDYEPDADLNILIIDWYKLDQ